jgi:signal peptidase II
VRRVALIAAAIILLDQATKLLVTRSIGDYEQRVVIEGFFNLVHSENTGAAWGIFQKRNDLLAVISVVTILALCLFRHSFQLHRKGSVIAFGLIMGGIVGNLIDRVRVGHVIDFLDFYMGTHHWPAFNVADSAICIGVTLYIIVSRHIDHPSQPARAAS